MECDTWYLSDYDIFEAALNSILEAIDRQASEQGESDPLDFADRELFASVVSARTSRQDVVRLLNEDWRRRLPISIEVQAIVRRPRRPEGVAAALGDLDQLLRKPWLPQSQDVRDELLEAVSEVREELNRERGHLAGPLERLESKIYD